MTKTNPDHVTRALRLAANAEALLVFDLETSDKTNNVHKGKTDGDHTGTPTGKVMQLAARRYAWDGRAGSGTLTHAMNVLMKDPDIRPCCLHPRAAATHLISIEDLHAPAGNPHLVDVARLDPREAWTDFLALADGAVLMGHNAINFDIPFANRELARFGLPPVLDAASAIDTLVLAQTVLSLASNRLRSTAEFLEVSTDPALDHNALGDIDTTFEIWKRLLPLSRDFAGRYLVTDGDPYTGRLGTLGAAWANAETPDRAPVTEGQAAA